MEMRPVLYQHLERLEGVEQNPEYHPEGDVLEHSLLTLRAALRETRCRELALAALFHDVGKVIESHGHSKHGVELIEGHVDEPVTWLVETHMRVSLYLSGELRPGKARKLDQHEWFPYAVLLYRWDHAARKPLGVKLSARYSRGWLDMQLGRARLPLPR